MKQIQKQFSLFCFLLFALQVFAQGPNGSGTYYSSANGKKGSALKTALCGVINGHTQLSYSQLWEAFKTTDVRSDGKVWDMYSNITNYTFGKDQAGSNKSEGDSYNREHSFPKSWFDDAKPMYTDLVHLVPTDSYVNGRRSNYPFGETYSPTYQSNGGFSKLGPSSVSGYSGTVFEPNDQYKGDFARIYFYMATCYENQISGWNCDMLAGNKYPAYKSWVIDMLLRWAAEDPVSEKEINRNNAVYAKQGNRNPYVDYPGLEQYVWGNKQDVAFSYDNYDSTNPKPNPNPDPDPTPDPEPNPDPEPVEGENMYVKVTSSADLQTGCGYLIVCESANMAMAESKTDIRNNAAVTINNGKIVTTVNTTGKPYQFELGGTAGAYTLYDATEKVYLALTTNGNKLNSLNDATSGNAKWTISVSSSKTEIKNNAYTSRYIDYNSSSPRFACYSNRQQPVTLYKYTSTTGVSNISADKVKRVDVYSITGMSVRKGVEAANALYGLPAGIYIINNKKYIVR